MDEYTIRVSGRLSDALLSAFPTLHGQTLPDPDRAAGELPDQSALQGVLNQLDELGIEIVEVAKLPQADGSAGTRQPRLRLHRD